MKYLYVFFIAALSTLTSFGQNNTQSSIGFEFQAYPTGLIPGIRYEKPLNSNSSLHLRLGYQWIRHRDLGKHDDERGTGFGFTVGYKRFFASSRWYGELRSDLWWNSIDWMDEVPSRVSGHTDIVVLQPTVSIGKAIPISENWTFNPALSFGFEWNVSTDGEPTGEGAIILVGFTIAKKI